MALPLIMYSTFPSKPAWALSILQKVPTLGRKIWGKFVTIVEHNALLLDAINAEKQRVNNKIEVTVMALQMKQGAQNVLRVVEEA